MSKKSRVAISMQTCWSDHCEIHKIILVINRNFPKIIRKYQRTFSNFTILIKMLLMTSESNFFHLRLMPVQLSWFISLNEYLCSVACKTSDRAITIFCSGCQSSRVRSVLCSLLLHYRYYYIFASVTLLIESYL